MPRATICLPTYNERENLEPMVAALLERLGPDDSILVIDDGSPDGTGELADRLAAKHAAASPCSTARRRRASAPPTWPDSSRALADGAELVLEMDCDFSHDPDDVPRLIAAAADADLVLGSRYVEGGRIEDWGAGRRFVSRAGSLYAQALLAARVRDLTGGFKCYRREVLERIDLDAVSSKGYAFQIETTYRALRAGFRVVEIPIAFTDREAGASKMSRSIVLEAIWRVPYLGLRALAGRLR